MRGLDEAGVCKGKFLCSMVLLIALLWYFASFKGSLFCLLKASSFPSSVLGIGGSSLPFLNLHCIGFGCLFSFHILNQAAFIQDFT